MGEPTAGVLRSVLQAAGYRLEDSGGVTVAVRESDHRAVLLASRSRPPADLVGRFPDGAVHRTIVYDQEPGDVARAQAAEHGVEVLEPSGLGPALGELLLPSVLVPGTRGGEPIAGDPFDAPFPPPLRGPLAVRPRIDRREAQELAGLDGARYTLRLVPYYVAPYRVREVAPDGGPGPVHRRLVAVSATTRRGEVWEEGTREVVGELPAPSERLAPQLDLEAAHAIALETVRRAHTVRVDHTELHAGALVVEARRVAPPPGSVRLGELSLVFVPFWYAESTQGRRVLDAVSGRGPVDLDAR
ncbi:MAG TPA: hypothetical protein VMH49_06775 [Thermoplasmata archaeon]|nr:hypothetical protein [Thermoplasmata archaeon]